jgi:hypothetical protein
MKTKLLTLLALGCAGLVAGCAARRVSHDYIFDVTGVVTSEDGEPVQDADVTLDVNGPVYEGVTPVKSVKRLTNSTGGFVFGYISGESGVKYMLTVRKEGFEHETVSGSAPPPGHHTIRLKRAGAGG